MKGEKMTLKEKIHQRNQKQGATNFKNGMNYEFEILARERKKALFAIRSAGSHSIIDIVAVRDNETRLLSIRKNGTWITKEIEDLLDLQEKAPENHNVYLVYKEGKNTKYEQVK